MIIEVDSPDCITVQDNHSLNKTWKNGMSLKPGVLYGLEDGDVITMGEVRLKFSTKDFEEEQKKEALQSHSSPELSKAAAFHVPETPAPGRRPAPDCESTPVPSLSKPAIPDTPETPSNRSALDDSSFFIAPSQPPPQKPSKTPPVNIYEMATQTVAPPSPPASSGKSTENSIEEKSTVVPSGSIFSEETQKVDLSAESPAEKKETNENSLFDQETQPVLAAAKKADLIFEEPTQVVCSDNGRDGSPEGSNGDLSANGGCDKEERSLCETAKSCAEKEAEATEDGCDDDEEETQIIAEEKEQQQPDENSAPHPLEVSNSFAECGIPNAQPAATPKTSSNDTQPFKPSEENPFVDGEDNEEEEEEDLFFQSSPPPDDPKSGSGVDEAQSNEKKDDDGGGGGDSDDGSEDLLAATPNSGMQSSPAAPLGRVSSSTPLKSSQESGLDDDGALLCNPSVHLSKISGQVSDEEDIEDTKILTRTSERDDTAVTDEDIEDTRIIAGASESERSSGEATKTEDAASKMELANGDGSEDDEEDEEEVIPSSQHSDALSGRSLSGRTNLLTLSMELTGATKSIAKVEGEVTGKLEEEVVSGNVANADATKSLTKVEGEVTGKPEEEVVSGNVAIADPPCKGEKATVSVDEVSPETRETDGMEESRAGDSIVAEGASVSQEKAPVKRRNIVRRTKCPEEIAEEITSESTRMVRNCSGLVSEDDDSDSYVPKDTPEPESEPLSLPSTQEFLQEQEARRSSAASAASAVDEADGDSSSDEDTLVIDETVGRPRPPPAAARAKAKPASSKKKAAAASASHKKNNATGPPPAPAAAAAKRKSAPVPAAADEPQNVRRSGRATKRPAKLMEEEEGEESPKKSGPTKKSNASNKKNRQLEVQQPSKNAPVEIDVGNADTFAEEHLAAPSRDLEPASVSPPPESKSLPEPDADSQVPKRGTKKPPAKSKPSPKKGKSRTKASPRSSSVQVQSEETEEVKDKSDPASIKSSPLPPPKSKAKRAGMATISPVKGASKSLERLVTPPSPAAKSSRAQVSKPATDAGAECEISAHSTKSKKRKEQSTENLPETEGEKDKSEPSSIKSPPLPPPKSKAKTAGMATPSPMKGASKSPERPVTPALPAAKSSRARASKSMTDKGAEGNFSVPSPKSKKRKEQNTEELPEPSPSKKAKVSKIGADMKSPARKRMVLEKKDDKKQPEEVPVKKAVSVKKVNASNKRNNQAEAEEISKDAHIEIETKGKNSGIRASRRGAKVTKALNTSETEQRQIEEKQEKSSPKTTKEEKSEKSSTKSAKLKTTNVAAPSVAKTPSGRSVAKKGSAKSSECPATPVTPASKTTRTSKRVADTVAEYKSPTPKPVQTLPKGRGKRKEQSIEKLTEASPSKKAKVSKAEVDVSSTPRKRAAREKKGTPPKEEPVKKPEPAKKTNASNKKSHQAEVQEPSKNTSVEADSKGKRSGVRASRGGTKMTKALNGSEEEPKPIEQKEEKSPKKAQKGSKKGKSTEIVKEASPASVPQGKKEPPPRPSRRRTRAKEEPVVESPTNSKTNAVPPPEVKGAATSLKGRRRTLARVISNISLS